MAVHNQGIIVCSKRKRVLTLSPIVSHHGTVPGLSIRSNFLNDNLRMASATICLHRQQYSGHVDILRRKTSPVRMISFCLRTITMISLYRKIFPYHWQPLHNELPDWEDRITRRIIPPCSLPGINLLCHCGTVHSSQQSNSSQQITLVVPMPSLVNLSRKQPPLRTGLHVSGIRCHQWPGSHKFNYQGITVETSGEQSSDRMVIAVPVSEEVKIDIKEAFKLRTYKQDLLLIPMEVSTIPMLLNRKRLWFSNQYYCQMEPGQASVPVVKRLIFRFKSTLMVYQYKEDMPRITSEENRAKIWLLMHSTIIRMASVR